MCKRTLLSWGFAGELRNNFRREAVLFVVRNAWRETAEREISTTTKTANPAGGLGQTNKLGKGKNRLGNGKEKSKSKGEGKTNCKKRKKGSHEMEEHDHGTTDWEKWRQRRFSMVDWHLELRRVGWLVMGTSCTNDSITICSRPSEFHTRCFHIMGVCMVCEVATKDSKMTGTRWCVEEAVRFRMIWRNVTIFGTPIGFSARWRVVRTVGTLVGTQFGWAC